MAFQQNPDGTVEVVDDITGLPLAGGVPPEMLGSLYNPGAVSAAPPPAPDLRVAGPGGAPESVTSMVLGGGFSQPQSQPKGSHLPVGQQYAGGQAQTPAQASLMARLRGPESGPSPQAGAAPAPAAPADPTAPIMQAILQDAGKARPGAVINKPEKDVLVGFNKQIAPKLSEETKLEQEIAGVQQQRAAAEGGLLKSAAHQDMGLSFERQRESAQQQIAQIRDEERHRDQIVGAKMREIDMRSGELREARKGATNPEGYWEDKGQFGTVMAKIGMALYAAGASVTGADPMGLAKQINTEIDQYNQAKRLEVELIGNEIEDARTQLGDVRRQFISPEAADAATRALMLESAAAETAAQAQYHKSAEAQATAQELMATLRAQAADARAKSELAEQDAVTQAFKHQEAQRIVTGGGGGIDAVLKKGKALGLSAEQTVRLWSAGQLPMGKEELELRKASARGGYRREEHAMERQILLPDGTKVYSNSPDKAKKSEETINALDQLDKNISRMADLSSQKAAGRWSPELESDLRALVSDNRYLVKSAIAKEALTQGEKENFDPLAGADIGQILNYVSDKATVERLRSITANRLNAEKRVLYKDPEATQRLVDPVQGEKD